MKISSKLAIINAAIADLKAEQSDNLTPLELDAVAEYERITEPMNQYIDAMNGVGPIQSISGLPAGCTAVEAQAEYERELVKLKTWSNRRQALGKLK